MLSSLILQINNEPFLDQTVMCDEKWIVYNIWWLPAQWLDWEDAPKHFPKPNLHQKQVMVTDWWSAGGLIHYRFLVFWIPAKPLHLRSMLSKSIRCTENDNTCSQHYSIERAQFFSMTVPYRTLQTSTSKIEWIGLRSFASSVGWPLANHVIAPKNFYQVEIWTFEIFPFSFSLYVRGMPPNAFH